MISENYSQFFKELARNNNKDWFHANKKRYENEVKKPFLDLLDQIIPQLQKLEPGISSEAKSAIFRINKDVRFSKDKSPYHTIMKAGFSPDGKKSFLPGYYLGISADEIHIGGGLFMVQNPELEKIRNFIMGHSSEFLNIVEDKTFKSRVGEILGEKAKRFEKSLMEAAKKNRYIANKQFYAMADVPLNNHLDSDDLPSFLMSYFEVIDPLNQFLKRAF